MSLFSDPLKIKGEWWFPNNEIRFNGELTFTSNADGKLIIYGPEQSLAILDASRIQSEETKEDTEKSNICKRKEEKNLILGKSICEKLNGLSYSS